MELLFCYFCSGWVICGAVFYAVLNLGTWLDFEACPALVGDNGWSQRRGGLVGGWAAGFCHGFWGDLWDAVTEGFLGGYGFSAGWWLNGGGIRRFGADFAFYRWGYFSGEMRAG